ncbi:MAG: hypothetical protein CMB82_01180 [Flammeovirgaceae bacterium]|nr:hypothetical protein [Flammeovirgaceae bacterium]
MNCLYLKLSPSVSSVASLASSSAIELNVNNVNPVVIIYASNGSKNITSGATTNDNSLLMTFTLEGSSDNRIDVSSLSEGVYIIELGNRSGYCFSTRLIKE